MTFAFALRREIGAGSAAAYVLAQVLGGLAGALVARAMFELPILQVSQTMRTGVGQWVAELVVTFGLVATILAGLRFRQEAVPWLVGLYVTAAYWFTASTSFANPAVAIARDFSDTFAGIRPLDVRAFALAQCAGAGLAVLVFGWLMGPTPARTGEPVAAE